MAETVERMAEFERYAESMLTEIDSMVKSLHAAWSGEPAAAHAEAHRHWSQKRCASYRVPQRPRTTTTPGPRRRT
jgi:uncharacterized protein YukE